MTSRNPSSPRQWTRDGTAHQNSITTTASDIVLARAENSPTPGRAPLRWFVTLFTHTSGPPRGRRHTSDPHPPTCREHVSPHCGPDCDSGLPGRRTQREIGGRTVTTREKRPFIHIAVISAHRRHQTGDVCDHRHWTCSNPLG